MRIVIDMQGAQTASRFRGIGRYTIAFAKAIVANRGDHDIFLALNGLFPDTIEPLRAAFQGMLSQDHILVWHAPSPMTLMHPVHDARHASAELIREAFLAQLQPDLVHISSLFEGYLDDAVISMQLLDRKTPISVSFYDLIPHLNPVQYLDPNPQYAGFYRKRLAQLHKAAVILAISDYSKQEALDNFPELSGRVDAVSTAVDTHFRVVEIPAAQAASLRHQFGIEKPFLLYTGGDDERKNLHRLLQAYARLPLPLRQQHQLFFAGKMSADVVTRLRQYARSVGLKDHELLFSGFVSDEQLVMLYNLCQLFVFPSWQEGFGLPVLEAMACGAVVIASNTSSLPEVIGLDEAMFDPMDVDAIAAKILQALQDPELRDTLRSHGQQQAAKFSWDAVALRALSAWEHVHQHHIQDIPPAAQSGKPRMAYVSPMPPERTGIADYSAELLPALSVYYDIELILEQASPMTPLAGFDFPVRDAGWLRQHAGAYDRVIYQVGNSPFHAYMLSLIQDVPGTVVLHDFFLSGLMSWLESQEGQTQAWAKALHVSHDYLAVQHRFKNPQAACQDYPVNWSVLQYARGVVVHSAYSRQLLQSWYGAAAPLDVAVVPLLRQLADGMDKVAARRQLGWSEEDFVVCSFGFLDHSKLNHLLLQAWLDSDLASAPSCKLVFVGQNEGGAYGAEMLRSIGQSGRKNRILITGFVTHENYQLHLAAADVAVQLRTQSRGETSAAALDCLNFGLPLIVNANGSMAELSPDSVWMLPDAFDQNQLRQALECLHQDPKQRRAMRSHGQQIIKAHHTPASCARKYATFIEQVHAAQPVTEAALLQSLVNVLPDTPSEDELLNLARVLDLNQCAEHTARVLYLDVTATCKHDRQTGIERVVRALILAFMQSPPKGYRVEPVYLSQEVGRWCHRRASHYTLNLLGCPSVGWQDEVVLPKNGDFMLVLDLAGDTFVSAQQNGLFDHYRQQAVIVHALVYDLLPVTLPEVFPPGADRTHEKWLAAISTLDGALCISSAVQKELALWQAQANLGEAVRRPFALNYFHLGADMQQSAPSFGLPRNAQTLLQRFGEHPSFLMVGTIEPRKNHLQVIEAFDQLWRQGMKVNLVIVGREGWIGLDPAQRRNIPRVIELLRHHPARQQHLFWLDDISDEFLEQVYGASTCLIAASLGEGFGLPLIEAARHKLSVLARDLPVFREVAGDSADYFTAKDATGLALAVQGWLSREPDRTVQSRVLEPQTWNQSVTQIIQAIWPGNARP